MDALINGAKGQIMWVGRTDWDGAKMFAEAHVQMLARDWGHPVPGESASPKPRHQLHVMPHRVHLHHLRLHHAAHG